MSDVLDPLSPLKRPFPHPNVSRLRSTTPHSSRSTSAASATNDHTEALSASPSHFSALSKGSISAPSHHSAPYDLHDDAREVFRWTQLRHIGENIYGNHPMKALTLLGSQMVGSPTVLAANGLICIGTDLGKIFVFDFKQNLKCICGEDQQGNPYLYNDVISINPRVFFSWTGYRLVIVLRPHICGIRTCFRNYSAL